MFTNYTNKKKSILFRHPDAPNGEEGSNLYFYKRSHNKSFTLIELLVVLALVAILSVVVVMTLNPAELIKQARDSNRLSDLSTINTALNLFSADVTSGFMGTSTVVYVSIPDNASSMCGSLGLPTLPSGYTYNCVTTANLRNTNGSGWIPVNFQRISSNSPISQLPVDPINTTSTRLYYTYVSGGSWELNASVEASKNKLGGSGDLTSKDGGNAVSTYEIGNNLTLNPIEAGDSSLVGYWNFENDVLDHSGFGNNGTWYGTSTTRYVSRKTGDNGGIFNGSGDYVDCGTSTVLNVDAFSVASWIKYEGTSSFTVIGWTNSSYPALYLNYTTNGPLIYLGNGNFRYFSKTIPVSLLDGSWHHVVFNVAGSNTSDMSNSILYVDGLSQNVASTNITTAQVAKTTFKIGKGAGYTSGSMDDVRVYNRALSAAEVLALYNATK